MNTNIQIFENSEFGQVRTMTNAEGEPLFCGKDVAEALGYNNPPKAIRDHVEEDDRTKRSLIVHKRQFCEKLSFTNDSLALQLASSVECFLPGCWKLVVNVR